MAGAVKEPGSIEAVFAPEVNPIFKATPVQPAVHAGEGGRENMVRGRAFDTI